MCQLPENPKCSCKSNLRSLILYFVVTMLVYSLAIGFIGITLLHTYNTYSVIQYLVQAYFTVNGWLIFMAAQAIPAGLVAVIINLLK